MINPDPRRTFANNEEWAIELAFMKMKQLAWPYTEWPLIQNAALTGLWEACLKYDTTINTAFRTYATFRIIGSVQDDLLSLEHWGKQRKNTWLNGYYSRIPKMIALGPIPFAKTDQSLKTVDNRERIETLLKHLSRRDKDMIKMHYIQGMKKVEIANHFGVCSSRVSQVIKEALECAREVCG